MRWQSFDPMTAGIPGCTVQRKSVFMCMARPGLYTLQCLKLGNSFWKGKLYCIDRPIAEIAVSQRWNSTTDKVLPLVGRSIRQLERLFYYAHISVHSSRLARTIDGNEKYNFILCCIRLPQLKVSISKRIIERNRPIETKHKLNCFHGFHNVCSLRFISLYFSCGGFVKVSHFHMRRSSVRVSSNKCFHTEKEMNERNVRQLDQSSRSTHWIIQFRGDKMDKTKNTRQPLFESYIFALPRGIIYALHIALRPPPLTHKWDMLKDTLSFTRIAICSAHIYFSFFCAIQKCCAKSHCESS